MLSNVLRFVLPLFVRLLALPKRIITRDDGRPYLERYYLLGEPGGLKYFDEGQREQRWWQKAFSWLPCVYLHRFVSSDEDPELHNHPWKAKSLILSGGYVEERRMPDPLLFLRTGKTDGYVVIEQTFLPGSVNYLFSDTFHRVRLIESDCWTVIALGEKVQSWGFWSAETGKFLPWREHAKLRASRRAERAATEAFFEKMNARGGNA